MANTPQYRELGMKRANKPGLESSVLGAMIQDTPKKN
eukprot:CAMPEP_0174361760 /NCGR_PEP_ID=MMETSP0811_2-20130205/60732_1 /TAXON_ID=73025 ORGANISM="Eutreptiella gymnastica-like, Strain CCMP1594" /NCGR_SAMPLE_ID=MMETSP0811_2 /ASSEMBLY_ACC=CAM_ASM_000667 /LENGTH=36 /DNA_ID= /DNA_START= /DNA_END= /DNA_ORIENTATION=